MQVAAIALQTAIVETKPWLWSAWKVRSSDLHCLSDTTAILKSFLAGKNWEQLIEALQKAQAALPGVKPVA